MSATENPVKRRRYVRFDVPGKPTLHPESKAIDAPAPDRDWTIKDVRIGNRT